VRAVAERNVLRERRTYPVRVCRSLPPPLRSPASHAEGALHRKRTKKTRKRPPTPQPTSQREGLRERRLALGAAGMLRASTVAATHAAGIIPLWWHALFLTRCASKHQTPWYHKASRTLEYPESPSHP
jgi:hypothetical protein